MKKYTITIVILFILIIFSCKKEEKIIETDTTAPIIQLKGSTTIQLELGSPFIDSGYTATDNIDGDLTAKVVVTGVVDELKQGIYLIQYNVTDSAGNKATEKIRTIIIHRTLAPQPYQKGFAINYTGTYAAPCGDWGSPRIHTYAADAPEGAIISVHVTLDPMKTPLYLSFSQDRGTGGGIPSFWVGDEKTSDKNSMSYYIKSHLTPGAGIDYNYHNEGDSLFIETATKFYSSSNGDYYLSVLILEDGIDGSSSAPTDYIQAGTSTSYPNDDFTHDFVLRTSSVHNSAYGELLIQNPSLDTVITKNYIINIDPNWNNPYPVCIIWKYEPGTKPEYHYINSLKRKNDISKGW